MRVCESESVRESVCTRVQKCVCVCVYVQESERLCVGDEQASGRSGVRRGRGAVVVSQPLFSLPSSRLGLGLSFVLLQSLRGSGSRHFHIRFRPSSSTSPGEAY